MLFNSFEFIVFLPLVFLLYWFVFSKNIKLQNTFVLFSSYLFYGWWDWRFLGLIILSSGIDFFIGLGISKSLDSKRKKRLLYLSLFVNLGLLGVFKYYNFFVESFGNLLAQFSIHPNLDTLSIILPIGISFYTFQTLSYSIDVYKGKLAPVKDPIAFFTFVSFFPQLVAGPIERAVNLLPQFQVERKFEYSKAKDGCRQILWGFFKKVVIADSCAIFVNAIFENSADLSGSILVIGAVLFAFQIYCDFSGYSDIAIGVARLFGFDLMKNFNFPYFSRDIGEFWRKWHISLSSWFRDYLYIPLGGSRGTTSKNIRNVFIIFLVSGFWHGANWTFIVWGGIHALFFIPLFLLKKNRQHLDVVAKDSFFPSLKELLSILFTFSITCFAWVFFRATSVTEAMLYLKNIAINPFANPFQGFTKIGLSVYDLSNLPLLLVCILLLISTEWFQRKKEHGLNQIAFPKIIRWPFYMFLGVLILNYFGGNNDFIYFQF